MDFEKMVKARNSLPGYTESIGLKIKEINLGSAITEMPLGQDYSNPIDSVHGGIIFTVADVTGGCAAISHESMVTTLDASIHYLRAGINTEKLIGRAREVKAGKRVLVYDVTVEDQNGVVLAEGMFSYMSLGIPLPPEMRGE